MNTPSNPVHSASELSPDAHAWVRSTLSSLTPAQKIGQVIHPLLSGWDGTDREGKFAAFSHHQLGGGFFGTSSWKTQRTLIEKLSAHAAVPPIFTGDYECGALQIEEAQRFGLAMSLAAVRDLDDARRLAFEVGKAAALQGGAVGVRWSFSPVVDLNLNPDNPITNVRSYGDDVERVIACSTAYLRGMQEHGLAATIKHFPGDGVDGRDQHLATTVNTLSPEEWQRTFGRTFRAGIDAGAAAVMMGHIALAGVSSRDEHRRYLPATLDPQMHRMLREELGFQGLIVSDALRMVGARAHCRTEGETVVRNLAAGSDVALFVENIPAAVEALHTALDNGTLPHERLDDAVRRVLILKARLGLHEPRASLSEKEAASWFEPERFAPLAHEVAGKSLTLARNRDGAWPLRVAAGAKVVLFHLPRETSHHAGIQVGGEGERRPPQSTLERVLCERGLTAVTVYNDAEARAQLPDAAALVYITTTVPEAGRGSIRLAKQAHAWLDWERITSDFPTLFVSLGSPYVGWELPDVPNLVCGYFSAPNIEEALALAMLGEIPLQGQLPVHPPMQ